MPGKIGVAVLPPTAETSQLFESRRETRVKPVTPQRRSVLAAALALTVTFTLTWALTSATPSWAFLEDLCVSPDHKIRSCIEPNEACKIKPGPNAVCPAQLQQSFAMVFRHSPGRSMVHADATYFLAQAVGYRADVAYWIAAYNEVADQTRYAPIDQCGNQATATNSGKNFVTLQFNGFQRTNVKLDGPLYHYVVPFSPGGDGRDAHGANGVRALYPLHSPAPGYPQAIDDVYQGTLANLRQWAMRADSSAGLLCAAGLTEPNGPSHFGGANCLRDVSIQGAVPLIARSSVGPNITAHSGPKILDNSQGEVTYEQLGNWLKDGKRTSGALWKDPASTSVPEQIVRFGLYTHSLQDTASHSPCADEAPGSTGKSDPGTYMAFENGGVKLHFGSTCATVAHLVGHIQETATGDAPLPLRDYTALKMTLDELIAFGNAVAGPQGWIVNPQLLPSDVTGGRNTLGKSAQDLSDALVGSIAGGAEWSGAETYRSGLVTRPLQEKEAIDRLHALNAGLKAYSDELRTASGSAPFAPLELMPGNAADPNDGSVCFK